MSDQGNPIDYYPRRSKWVRAVFSIVVLFGYGFAEALLWFLTLLQFLWVGFKAEPNEHIQRFSGRLITWTSTAIAFCLWKSDLPPFPFTSWPDES